MRTGTGVAGKRITLKNLHTGEELETEFFRGGEYVGDSFAAIQVLLRDFRNDEQHAIDPKLMDYLFDVAQHLGVDPVFSVISGYGRRKPTRCCASAAAASRGIACIWRDAPSTCGSPVSIVRTSPAAHWI